MTLRQSHPLRLSCGLRPRFNLRLYGRALAIGTNRLRFALHGGQRLLLPHDEVAESKRLQDFVRFEITV